jgi:hypothetical protein
LTTCAQIYRLSFRARRLAWNREVVRITLLSYPATGGGRNKKCTIRDAGFAIQENNLNSRIPDSRFRKRASARSVVNCPSARLSKIEETNLSPMGKREEDNSPLPWGEGVTLPALSSAGA